VTATRVYDVTCHACKVESQVGEVHYPATRYDPPDGETQPEECPSCGEPWGEFSLWVEAEPPEPLLEEWWGEW
jgi:hypothetical protein